MSDHPEQFKKFNEWNKNRDNQLKWGDEFAEKSDQDKFKMWLKK